MADVVDTTNVPEVPEVPAEVVSSKETVTDPEAVAVDKIDVPVDGKAENGDVPAKEPISNGGDAKTDTENGDVPNKNGSSHDDDKHSENGSGTNDDDTLERKRKQDAVEAALEGNTEVSADKKAKLEEKSEGKQDEVESSNNGEAEVAA